ncbi:MAG: energy-coupled thiamine transporter ThiT [bacterium]
MQKNRKVVILAETGIFVAIAVVLDLLFGAIYSLPMGGSISIAMLPIFIIAARRGWKYGLVAGALYGLVQTMIKVYFLSLPQYVMDYLVSFMVVGLAGIVPAMLKKPSRFAAGILLGSFLRLIAATLTGLLYWRAFIPDEIVFMNGLFGSDIGAIFASDDAAITFAAFLYNSLYMIPSAILCVLVGLILHRRGVIQFHLDRTA